MIQLLLDTGADINAVDAQDLSVLEIACEEAHDELTKLLPEKENTPKLSMSEAFLVALMSEELPETIDCHTIQELGVK